MSTKMTQEKYDKQVEAYEEAMQVYMNAIEKGDETAREYLELTIADYNAFLRDNEYTRFEDNKSEDIEYDSTVIDDTHYTAGTTSTSQANAPDTISAATGQMLILTGNTNKVTIYEGEVADGNKVDEYDTNGYTGEETLQENDIVVIGGVSYIYKTDENGELVGHRLMDYGANGSGNNLVTVYDENGNPYEAPVENVIQVYNEETGKFEYSIVIPKQEEYVPEEAPPPEPPPITYKDVNLYDYIFGIDHLKISHCITTNLSYFVSDSIDIGDVNDSCHISLSVSDYSPEYTSIEYYIIDNNKTIPILPNEKSYIKHEKLFEGLPTRFKIDTTKKYVIQKDCIDDLSLTYDNINFFDGHLYTISYYPVVSNYIPESQNIKVKAILRKYKDDIAAPYVKSINVVKSGGGALWEDIYETSD